MKIGTSYFIASEKKKNNTILLSMWIEEITMKQAKEEMKVLDNEFANHGYAIYKQTLLVEKHNG